MTLVNFSTFFQENPYTKQYLGLILKKNIKSQKKFLSFETRRRLQIYSAIDYYNFTGTFYDFLSPGVIKMLLRSKIIAYFLGKNIVTSDILLYSYFLENNSPIKQLTILKKIIGRLVWKNWNKLITPNKDFYISSLINIPFEIYYLLQSFVTKYKYKSRIVLYIIKLFKIFKNKIFKNKNKKKLKFIHKNIKFSPEIYKILMLTLKQGTIKYNTPIITPESVFINIFENKNSLGFKILNTALLTSSEKAKIRYEALKKIYCLELRTFDYIPKSLFLYDYFLRSRLSEDLFLKISSDPLIHLFLILFFRLKLFQKILSYKFLRYMKYTILKSLF